MSTRAATHYELIGLSREATPEEIKSAFRAQAQIHHPDAGGDTEAFTALSAAYEVLTDPDRRADYDATLPAEGASRFGGWARPTSERSEPVRATSTEDEAPRRRPVSEVDGDDPAVFHRTSDLPAFRRETLPETERGDMDLGTVDEGDLRTVPEAALDESVGGDLAPRGAEELERPVRRESRWTFFGRRDREATETPTEPDEPAHKDREVEDREASFSRRAPVTEDRDDRADFAAADRRADREDRDGRADFAPAERRPSREDRDGRADFAPAGPSRSRRNDDFAGEFASAEPARAGRNDDFAGEFAPAERKGARRNDDFAGEFAPAERKGARRNDDFAGEFASADRRDRRY